MRNFFFFIFFFSWFLHIPSVQALDLTVSPLVRSYPFSGTVEAQLRHEVIVWDQRERAPYQFGFIQPKLTLGAHGMAEAALQFYPISFLELGAGTGVTSRFYDNRNFNCDENICQGVVQRQRLTARIAGGVKTEIGEWLGVLSFNRIRISHKDNSKPLMDEAEVLLCQPGSDTLESQSILLGLKRESETYGIYVKQSRYLEARTQNQFQYLIYRKTDGAWSYGGGLGRYASDFIEPGFSAYGMVSWTWGHSVSLF